jgi:hypothetical protein
MANPTTNYGFVLPTSTDLVTDLPADFDVALQGVDTRLKALQPGTTLGDIAYSSATANTNTRLPIGTTGQLLTVSGGVPAWVAAPSASPITETATVNTEQDTSSTSYANLATAGPAVTITTGTKALVIITTKIKNGNGEPAFMSFAVSGATTTAASDTNAIELNNSVASANYRWSAATSVTLTAGSNTFTAKYRSQSGAAATFSNRQIFVMNLG